MMDNLKIKLKNNRVLNPIYIFFATKYHERKNKKLKKLIKKKGADVVKFLANFFIKYSYIYFFDMGTLLGIIRENDFIGHDLDIDLGIICDSSLEKKEIIDHLIHEGAIIKYIFTKDNDIVEASFLFKQIKFDLNFYSNVGDYSFCYLLFRNPKKIYAGEQFDIVELKCSKIEKTKTIIFKGYSISIPSNALLYLEERYGKNWREPDKNYIYWKGPSATILEGKEGTRTIYK